jgi:broad specificity phosphatase PhoE
MMDNSRVVAYFVRHGETLLNAEGRFRGPIDVPLSDKGENDAEELANFFAKIKLGEAWTSARQRSAVTADTILAPKGMAASPTESLYAWNVGGLAGEKKSDHKSDVEYYQRNPSLPIPGGESLDDFRTRVNPSIKNALYAGIKRGDPSLVVAHSSIIHQVNHLIHQDHTRNLVSPGGVLQVNYNGKQFSTQVALKPEPPEEASNAL